jgi:hypothetical protein
MPKPKKRTIQRMAVTLLGKIRGKAAPIRVEKKCMDDITIEARMNTQKKLSLVAKRVTTIKDCKMSLKRILTLSPISARKISRKL